MSQMTALEPRVYYSRSTTAVRFVMELTAMRYRQNADISERSST
jgi:hypothetical protein